MPSPSRSRCCKRRWSARRKNWAASIPELQPNRQGGNGPRHRRAQGINEGLVAVLQCVEPCWTFDVKSRNGGLNVQGERGKCSPLYHYYLHPQFGWMYVRLQTWFPFEIQVYLNGREWLARQLDRERAEVSPQRQQVSLGGRLVSVPSSCSIEQLRTSWPTVLDELQRAGPSACIPAIWDGCRVPYNWTVFQSEWATDVAFRSRPDLEQFYGRWVRHAFLNFDSAKILRFLGRSGRLQGNGPTCTRMWNGL